MSIGILGVILFCALLSTVLFKKAAGTLALGKLNMISYVYYLFMAQTFVGITLIKLGFDKHYSLSALLSRESSIQSAFVCIMLVSILLPTVLIVLQRIMKTNVKERYENYLRERIEVKNAKSIFYFVLLVTFFAAIILGAYLLKIGYIPALRLIRAPEGFEFAKERIRISGLYVISPYISNIVLRIFIPIFAYIAFAYLLATKKKCWFVLASMLLGMSGIVYTNSFAKTPLVFHVLSYVLIVVYTCGGIKNFVMFLCGGIGAVFISLMYLLTGYEGTLFDLYNGPIGRTLFTQVGTLTYVFDLFPNVFPFLGGRSLTPTVLRLLGEDPDSHLRSARLVMAYFGSHHVYDGIAGVMNTVFFGEAYANYGYAGIVISVIVVACVITFFFMLILKLRKTPIMLAFAATMTVKIGSVSQGGFVDFIYNVDWIITLLVCVMGYYCLESDSKISKWIQKRIVDIELFIRRIFAVIGRKNQSK